MICSSWQQPKAAHKGLPVIPITDKRGRALTNIRHLPAAHLRRHLLFLRRVAAAAEAPVVAGRQPQACAHVIGVHSGVGVPVALLGGGVGGAEAVRADGAVDRTDRVVG